MNGKLDILLTQHGDHGKRIAVLEASRNKALGVGVAVSAVVSFVASQAPALFAVLKH